MTCIECRERLHEVDAEVALHLESCAACRRERARHGRLVTLLEAFPAAEAEGARARGRWLPLMAGLAAGVLLTLGLAGRGPDADVVAGHRLTATPGTVVQRRGTTEVELRRGVLHGRGSGGGLTIVTPAAKVEVIGTEFWIEVEDGMNTWGRLGTGAVMGIAVTAGVVRVTNAHGDVRVEAGQRATASSSTAPEIAADLAQLKAERDELARRAAEAPKADPRVEALRKRLVELETAQRPAPASSKAAAAREIFEQFLKGVKDDAAGRGNERTMIQLLARLSELDESVAPVLIGLYREQTESPAREVALVLALRCGGPGASDLLADWLEDGLVPEKERVQTLQTFGSQMESMFVRRLEVTDRLGVAAERYLGSKIAGERAGAVGILGWRSDDRSRTALQRALETDTEELVRASALRGLGRIGNRETLAWLRTVTARPGETLHVPGALQGAIRALEERYPEGK